ncbi:MAG: purine-nucleoside phosphorylase [Nanoarchaeota archaeon]|nr:purine-nucleoside phosphorylase [Nanoarchaeota archaeon]MBU1322415.1 purine-nucleoside phosphorylase [Nanoarchaeota archaeon]MBU1598164.1 purine-nucleoside phosphorylase [Nanoarchaeota archaeon]MBU2441429.1 purine-nucleoside phosphorylase [Nanoarchaeota archaeon]
MITDYMEQAEDFRDNYESKVAEAVNFIQMKFGFDEPEFGIVLGSGLGGLADAIENQQVVDYAEIPNFPRTGVEGHKGRLIKGTLEGVSVIALQGRKHYYEVADEPFNNGMLKVVFPVHVLANLGVKNYFATHAAGGLNPNYKPGDIMIIESHINFLPNPLMGRKHNFFKVGTEDFTERFQPMNNAYDPFLSDLLWTAAIDYQKYVHRGTLLSVVGPSYETEAECIAFRDGLHADVVGMSVTPEVIVARNRGMNCVGMSLITNTVTADGVNTANHEEVMKVLNSADVKLRLETIVSDFFALYRESHQQPL